MRNAVAGLLAVVVLAAVVGSAWWLLEDALSEDGGPTDGAAAALDDYLDAWERGDHLAMADLVRDPPEDFVALHESLAEGLEITGLTASADTVEEHDGRAVATVTLAFDLSATPTPATWTVEVELLRERGQWGVAWQPDVLHPDFRRGMEFAVLVEEVDRAPILAADGTQLAGSGQLVTLGFDPGQVSDPDRFVAAFEAAFPGVGERVERTLNRADLVEGWFYPVVTVSPDRADDARDHFRDVRGLLRRTGEGRAPFAAGFAQHVVGVVAEATAEELQRLGAPYEPGDHVGKYGLERAFESDLVGSASVRAVLRDGRTGTVRQVLLEHQDDPSAPLRTTLDVTVQQAVENALIGIERPAAIVVVDGTDGAIRAAASRPLDGYNRAFEGRYPPGSTFKVVTAEALLAGGLQPDTEVACPAEDVVGGLRVTNAGGLSRGDTTLADAFAWSCNTTFARQAAAHLGADGLAAAAQRFGFGQDLDLGIPAFGGSFPTPGDTAEVAAAAFGQARVEASTLHLASVAAAAANGTWHAPWLLADRPSPGSQRLSGGTLDGLRALLRAAVTDGTGAAADPGEDVEVLGKTGTAQGRGGVEHAWFAGVVNGLGFAVLVEEGGSGAEVAAPIAARFARELADLRAAVP